MMGLPLKSKYFKIIQAALQSQGRAFPPGLPGRSDFRSSMTLLYWLIIVLAFQYHYCLVTKPFFNVQLLILLLQTPIILLYFTDFFLGIALYPLLFITTDYNFIWCRIYIYNLVCIVSSVVPWHVRRVLPFFVD